MPRGYRYVILAALVSLTVCAFGLGYYHAALNYPQKQQYQPYRYAADKPQEIDPATAGMPSAKPFQYRSPCDEPKGQNESDLCAQWRAAMAGENSAFWAMWGFWIGAIGSSLLLWQIKLTSKAVKDTGDATKAMQETNYPIFRPRLEIKRVHIEDGRPDRMPQVLFSIFNVGGDGATIIHIKTKIVVSRSLPPMPAYAGEDTPRNEEMMLGRWRHNERADTRQICESESYSLKMGTANLYFIGFVNYETAADIARKPFHRTAFARVWKNGNFVALDDWEPNRSEYEYMT